MAAASTGPVVGISTWVVPSEGAHRKATEQARGARPAQPGPRGKADTVPDGTGSAERAGAAADRGCAREVRARWSGWHGASGATLCTLASAHCSDSGRLGSSTRSAAQGGRIRWSLVMSS
jgi:hypothetical protein